MSITKKPTRVEGSILRKVVATELQNERDNCDFDQEELKRFFTKPFEREETNRVLKDMKENPGFENTHKFYEYTPEEVVQSSYRKLNIAKRIYSTQTHNGAFSYFGREDEGLFNWTYPHQGQHVMAHALHCTMFHRSLDKFSTPEQREKWLPLAESMSIHGCYAQTEIGHGSDVSGLLTTATFDVKTDEFVIHTPEPMATKWWPGELGRSATHAIVFAKLLIPDEDGEANNYGVAPFIVQLRSLETHKHLPGVKTGEMGPKLGYHGKDNGWGVFDKVRIPRENMLGKFIQVDREGTFSIEGDLREMYAVMMFIRNGLIIKTRQFISSGITIGLRYSVVRRQFKNISGQKEETQIIDYQTQQMKLFPILAHLFAVQVTQERISDMYLQLTKGVALGDFSKMDLLHHLTAGGKSLFTQDCHDALILIRQSLGGAGYSAWSGIPYLIQQYSPDVTFEGDNTVMAQQSFNYLRKLLKKLQNGRIQDQEFFEYLNEMKELTSKKCLGTDFNHFLIVENVFTALKVSLAFKMQRIQKRIQENQATKKDFNNTLFATDIVQVSQEHTRYISFWLFRERITNDSIKCKKLEGHMTNLCLLYGLVHLKKDTSACYESGYFANSPFSAFINEAIKHLLIAIRPYAISLVEGYEVDDHIIQSAIGNSYGDIYETHLRWAKDSKLNHTKLGDAIPDGYFENVHPLKGKL